MIFGKKVQSFAISKSNICVNFGYSSDLSEKKWHLYERQCFRGIRTRINICLFADLSQQSIYHNLKELINLNCTQKQATQTWKIAKLFGVFGKRETLKKSDRWFPNFQRKKKLYLVILLGVELCFVFFSCYITYTIQVIDDDVSNRNFTPVIPACQTVMLWEKVYNFLLWWRLYGAAFWPSSHGSPSHRLHFIHKMGNAQDCNKNKVCLKQIYTKNYFGLLIYELEW